MGKYNNIRHIVRLRQMLRSWRRKAASHRSPPDVPPGHVAVCVGPDRRRFVVRAAHLNHPVFRRLLSQAEEEYGFAGRPGPLAIPCCDESLFEEVLRAVSRADPDPGRCCHVGVRRGGSDFFGESRPLLFGFSA
ncbi:SAUR-like auxin-responsive protein family [Striga asiatica]|uniref:SAUR-like auxin-responsive protein family n=1 Tax=Striga asiatica TaxID=4170 RepID=A0A5A7R1P6_STRAF|nr:SAUR-like auxin-responsive protein family [Striga asiatica]